MRSQATQKVRPHWLHRQWKRAAGSLVEKYLPAAPFTALQLFGEPPTPLRERQSPRLIDNVGRKLAEHLSQTPQADAVLAGEAAFVLDLPGPVSVATGFYLQQYGILPVLLFSGLYQPGALLEGADSLAALIRYGQQIEPAKPTATASFAFLLERDRSGSPQIDELAFWRTFDNRYRVGDYLFPPLPLLKELELSAFIDLRLEGDDLPDDINRFYRYAALQGFDIYQAVLPAAWFANEG